MSRDRRRELIRGLEDQRGSRILAYVTGDRPPAGAQIGDDSVRPMYDHLREIGHVERLDLFIYSRGGAIDVPWRIVNALRQASDEWNILVPFRANSAATLIALGADNIVLGPQGELGPIDPIMTVQRAIPQPGGGQTVGQENLSIEDIMAYAKFVQERAGLSDQTALSNSLSKLTDRIDAVSLGSVYRTHLHIRDVARRMIRSRRNPVNEQTMAATIETLAERVYAHGHAIGRREAEEIGLPVTAASDELDAAMWELLGEYEDDLSLLAPLDPVEAIRNTDTYREDGVLAVVETATAGHEFSGQIEVTAKRQMPPNLNVTVNLNLQLANLPPNVQQALQQSLQQAQQGLVQQAQQAVQDALKTQAPLVGVEAAFRGGVWKRYAGTACDSPRASTLDSGGTTPQEGEAT